jgi:alpha-1,2-mannosyltransferase
MQPAAKGRDGRLAQSKPMSASGPVTEYCSRPRLLARRLVEVARRRQVRRASLVACAALLGYALVRHLALHLDMVDMQVYRAEGQAVLDHRSLYAMRATRANLAATYPPFAALLFTPLAVLPVAVLRMLVTGANIGLLGVLGLLSCRFADWPGPAARPAVAVLAAGLGVWLEPMWTTLNYGQINLLLAVLVLWDLTLPDDRRHKGMAIGIAAGIKLTPALFIVYLLLSRRVRSAVVAGATALGTAVVGAVLLPGNSVAFWTKDLFDTGRVGQVWIVDNQSLRGMLARLSHTPDPGPWAVLVVAAVGALGLAVAAASARAAGRTPRAEAWGGLCCAITALLVSPISWSHHWVWCLPVIVLLAAEASQHRRWRAAVAAAVVVFTCQCIWLVPHRGDRALHLPYWEMPFASAYPLAGLAFLGLAGLRLLDRPSEPVRAAADERAPDLVARAG